MVLFEGASNLQTASHSWSLVALQRHGGKDGKVLKSNLFMLIIARVTILETRLINAPSHRQVAEINGAEAELVEYLSAQVDL